jgi:hypothetical protein
MHDRSTELAHTVQRARDVAHGEVRQRKRITGAASALVDTEPRAVRAGLPALPFGCLASRQLHPKNPAPKLPRTLRVVGGELDQRQGNARH